MPFSPEELENWPFTTERHGYTKQEVSSFAAAVATEHRRLLSELELARRELTDCRARAAEVEARVTELADPWAQMGEEVATIMRGTHEAATALRHRFEQEAESVRKAAREEAERIAAVARMAREESERQAAEVISAAKREAEQLLDRELARHELMREAEQEMLHRFQEAEAILATVRHELEAPEISPPLRRREIDIRDRALQRGPFDQANPDSRTEPRG